MGIDPKGHADPKRIGVANDFRLGKQLKPEDYTLEINAVDKNAPEKRAKAGQTVDFEVVE